MSPVGFKPTISAGERLQAYVLDQAATGTGLHYSLSQQIFMQGTQSCSLLIFQSVFMQYDYLQGADVPSTVKNRQYIYIYIQNVQLKSGPYFNMSNLFTKIYNILYYTTKLYLQ
jgi:hypothetical protein